MGRASAATVPRTARTKTPAAGVSWRCSGCGAKWPAWIQKNGSLTHAPECDEGSCAVCNPDGVTKRSLVEYDPTVPEKPLVPVGSFRVEFQTKMQDVRETPGHDTGQPIGTFASAKHVGGVLVPNTAMVPAASAALLGTTPWSPATPMNKYAVRVEYLDTWSLDPPKGFVISDRLGLERVLRALGHYPGSAAMKTRTSYGTFAESNVGLPRVYLRVTDHLGVHHKLEALTKLWPAPPTPPTPTYTVGWSGRLNNIWGQPAEGEPIDVGTPLTSAQRAAVFAIIAPGCIVVDPPAVPYVVMPLVYRADVVPDPTRTDAFEARRRALAREGRPTDVTRLFHGTCAHNIAGILREGLKPQHARSGGALGAGVYLGSEEKALSYAHACTPGHFIKWPEGRTPPSASLINGSVPCFRPLTKTSQAGLDYLAFGPLPEICPGHIDDRGVCYTCKRPSLIPSSLNRAQKRVMSKAIGRLHFALECDVLLGRIFTPSDVTGRETPRRALGRGDSAHFKFKHDEWCVYRADQILIHGVRILAEDPAPWRDK